MANTNKFHVTYYSCTAGNGLKNISIQDLNEIRTFTPNSRIIPNVDVLWTCRTWLKVKENPSWNGYMEVFSAYDQYSMSSISIIPFLRLNSSSPDATYSSLLFAIYECQKNNQRTYIVTFDQPLYAKATKMAASFGPHCELTSVVVGLGGFHMLISFMGTVGYIMSGTGLKELWALIYAPQSIDKMLNRHSYARAL